MSPDDKRVVACWALHSDASSLFPLSKVWKPPVDVLPAPYEIRVVDGKGFGMIATRAIKRGEIIVSERPILIIPRNLPSYRDMERCLLQLLYWLEQDDRERLVQLHNCKSLDEFGPLAGILRTNALIIGFSESQSQSPYSAICLDISRINHSCSNNARCHFDEESVIFSLRAYRDISVGEEITIGYIDEGMTHAERQSELEQAYRFTCACEKCSASASLIAFSDKRRTNVTANVSEVSSTFRQWWGVPRQAKRETLEASVRMIDGFLKMMEEEDVHRGRIDVMRVPAEMYGSFCDSENFKVWVCRILEYLRTTKETMGTQYMHRNQGSWERWLEDPTSFPLWDFWSGARGNIQEKMLTLNWYFNYIS